MNSTTNTAIDVRDYTNAEMDHRAPVPPVWLATAWGPMLVGYIRGADIGNPWAVCGKQGTQRSFCVHYGTLLHLTPEGAKKEQEDSVHPFSS